MADIVDRVALWTDSFDVMKAIAKLLGDNYFSGSQYDSPKEIIESFDIEPQDEVSGEGYSEVSEEMSDIQKVIAITQGRPEWGEWLCAVCLSLPNFNMFDRDQLKPILIKSLEIAATNGIDH